MKVLKRLIYIILIYSICIITPFIDVVFILLPIYWLMTGSILRKEITKGNKTFYVYTVTEVLYYNMDKYLTKLLKL